MNRRIFLATTAASVLTLATAGGAAAQSADAAQTLVRQVANDVLALIRSPAGDAAKQAEFVRIMDQYADMRQIAGFALGRYSRTMPDALKDRYVEAFKRFVAASYVSRFSEYSGETVDIGRARAGSGGYLVDTTVQRGAQPPLQVGWLNSDRSGRPLVSDFVVEGISMATSQRSEFTSLIGSYGGDTERFVQYLESRS